MEFGAYDLYRVDENQGNLEKLEYLRKNFLVSQLNFLNKLTSGSVKWFHSLCLMWLCFLVLYVTISKL